MNASFSTTERVFGCASELCVVDLPVSYQVLNNLVGVAKALRAEAKNGGHSLFLQQVEQLDYFVRGLISTVVPFNQFLTARKRELDGILAKSSLLERAGASKQEQQALRKYLEALGEESTNPLLTVILEEVSTSPISGTRCVVLPLPPLVPEANLYCSKLEGALPFTLSHPYTLRGTSFFDQIVLVGPPHWYSRMNWVFESPRSSSLVCAHYDCFRITRPTVERFINQTDISLETRSTTAISISANSDGQSDLPETNWDAVAQSGETGSFAFDSTTQGTIEARLYTLAGGHAVFLEAKDDRRELVIDLDLVDITGSQDENEDEGTICKLSTSELQPGHLILLRTEGGSDALETYANKRMGNRAVTIRNRLNIWKELFRSVVSHSVNETALIDRLNREGAVHANLINIKNWCSSHTIKPRDQKDFNAIMAVIGKAESAHTLWEEASLIDSSHRLAGHEIRRELLAIVRSVDLHVLAEKGIMVFTLPGGGSLTAFRIEDVEPQSRQVSANVLHKPFLVKS